MKPIGKPAIRAVVKHDDGREDRAVEHVARVFCDSIRAKALDAHLR